MKNILCFKLIWRMFRKYLRTERKQFNTNIAAIWELRVWAMASDQFAAKLLLLSLSDFTWLTVFNRQAIRCIPEIQGRHNWDKQDIHHIFNAQRQCFKLPLSQMEMIKALTALGEIITTCGYGWRKSLYLLEVLRKCL